MAMYNNLCVYTSIYVIAQLSKQFSDFVNER
jgi:hypothetical protein